MVGHLKHTVKNLLEAKRGVRVKPLEPPPPPAYGPVNAAYVLIKAKVNFFLSALMGILFSEHQQ